MQLTCSICYDDIEETCKIDSCNHIYCRSCITKWAREKINTCPCCRQKFNILTDANNKIIDYFIDKENNDWIDLDILWDGDNLLFGWSWNTWYLIFLGPPRDPFDEKIPLGPYNRKLNKGDRYMDMGHYQRVLA